WAGERPHPRLLSLRAISERGGAATRCPRAQIGPPPLSSGAPGELRLERRSPYEARAGRESRRDSHILQAEAFHRAALPLVERVVGHAVAHRPDAGLPSLAGLPHRQDRRARPARRRAACGRRSDRVLRLRPLRNGAWSRLARTPYPPWAGGLRC